MKDHKVYHNLCDFEVEYSKFKYESLAIIISTNVTCSNDL
jgi:hypothetical protein